jgi:alkylation response protein AidB-like acyl-CoA dehydrogenase
LFSSFDLLVLSVYCYLSILPIHRFYIVNGQKKWITNGIYADFFTTAVRTGGKGHGGISMLLIERGPGVK